jgi:hypothetical protein
MVPLIIAPSIISAAYATSTACLAVLTPVRDEQRADHPRKAPISAL